jgi:hypothetical protein
MVMLLTIGALCISGNAMASEEGLRKEILDLKAKLDEFGQLKARVVELEKKLYAQGCSISSQGTTVEEIKKSLIEYKPGEGLTVPPCGIEITTGATLVLQGATDANNAQDREASSLGAAWSADIFIQKAFDDYAIALMHLEPGQGQGAEDELSLFSNVNRDNNDTGANVPVTELWYEHYLFHKQVAITAGKMDPANYLDQNEYAHDETTQFLGRIFKQNPAIEWPDDNTLGARLIIAPEVISGLSIESTYFDADNDWENILDRPFVSAQLNIEPAAILHADKGRWNGNYRFYWWMDGRDRAKLVGAGENPADAVKKFNYGFGMSIDQAITDALGVFGRFGWQRPEIAQLSVSPNSAPVFISWSGGLQVNGILWNRPDDVFALGVGQLFPSRHYKDAGNGGAAEGHLEAYYYFKVTKNLAISPDLQLIWNPDGINEPYHGDDNTIFVYGVRAQLNF